MKKIMAITLALVMLLSMALTGCSKKNADTITLWTYPIGNWGNENEVLKLTDAFTADTGIKVKVEYLAYADGDDKVNSAITSNTTPDLIMEGPERLVANWGAKGNMVDLSDLIDSTDKSQINAACLTACTSSDGKIYEYPLVMTAHCMAINKTAFEKAGALQYVDLNTHTWTTENFVKAVNALYACYGDTVGAVFCKGQGGDQGTRALVNNMYGGTYTDSAHSKYTWDDANNIKALKELYGLNGIKFDASLEGGDEIQLFCQGVLKMAFCWNIAQQLNPGAQGGAAGKTYDGDEIAFMSFPSQDGKAQLCGGIWGFGIFNNGDDARIEAAKTFIKWMCDSEHTVEAVKTANYFAARSKAEDTDLSTIWADNQVMNDYNVLMQYLGDYYQVTKGWAAARTAWWTTLQAIGSGTDVSTAVANGVAEANKAT